MFAKPPPPPRPAPLRVAPFTARFLLLFGGIWAAVGLLATVVLNLVSRPVWDDWALDARGVRADAEAIAAHTTSTRVNGRRVVDIEVRFTDGGGHACTATVGTANPATIAAGHPGGKIGIDYDPRDPSLARVAGGSASVMGLLGFLPLGFAVVGGWLFVAGFFQARRAQRLYREGLAAEARVTEVTSTALQQNHRRLMEMRYEVTTPGGPAKGAWRTATPAEVGAVIWVVYDPSDPGRSVPSQS